MISTQCRAARALLDWTQEKLAEAAGVGNATIRNFESDLSVPQTATIEALQRAFELAGVEFTNGGEPGVKFAKITPKTLTEREEEVAAQIAKARQKQATESSSRNEIALALEGDILRYRAEKGKAPLQIGRLNDTITIRKNGHHIEIQVVNSNRFKYTTFFEITKDANFLTRDKMLDALSEFLNRI